MAALPMTVGVVASAAGVSADGSTVVGVADERAVRWGPGGGMQNLQTPPFIGSSATGASADATVIVGWGETPQGDRAFRWTSATGMQDLGSDSFTYAYAVSSDGSVVVGESNGSAFRWTAPEGMVRLGFSSTAYAASADGAVIVGEAHAGSGPPRAFRWTATTGMVALGVLPGGTSSIARGINADGGAIVGRGNSGAGWRAWYWTQNLGMLDLNDYLPTLGIDLTGWTLTSASAISLDGVSIVGEGTHNGATEAWRADLRGRCYANCDGSTTPPVANVADFTCFLQKFAASDPYANCDASTTPPTINVADFTCFLQKFAAGCP